MSKMRSRYSQCELEDFEDVWQHLSTYAEAHGLQIERREVEAPMYQLARIIGSNFRVIVYPHQTSARNYHIRLRHEWTKHAGSAEAAARCIANIQAHKRKPFTVELNTKHQFYCQEQP